MARLLQQHPLDTSETRSAGRCGFHGGGGVMMLVLCLFGGLIGCAARPAPIVVTENLRSPYPENKVWAVAPLQNDSGVSTIDTLALTDQVIDEVSKIRGVDALPLNRTLEGMRSMNLGRVSSTDEALALARTLNVDGLIVGTISAFDPYSPPKMGMTLQLFNPGLRGAESSSVDVAALQSAAREENLPGLTTYRQPVASVSEIVDSQDNDVVVHLQQYAMGRSNPNSALGWRRYLVDMNLYTHYVAYRLLDRMLTQESGRLTQTTMATAEKNDDRRALGRN